MEIVGTVGYLTDYEVRELLESDMFKQCATLTDHKRAIFKAKKSADEAKRAIRNATVASGNETNRGKGQQTLSKDALRAVEQKLEQSTRQYHRLRELQELIWVREKTLNHLATRPAATQSQEHVNTFLTRLTELKRKMKFELVPQEVLHLVNHRPVSTVDLHVLIEEYSERLSSEQIDALLALVEECLPEAPVVDDTVGEESPSQGESKEIEGDLEADTLDDSDILSDEERVRRVASSAMQSYLASEENELNRDARAQADRDNDGVEAIDDDVAPAVMQDTLGDQFEMPIPGIPLDVDVEITGSTSYARSQRSGNTTKTEEKPAARRGRPPKR